MQINRHTFYPSKDTFNICAVSKKRERERHKFQHRERKKERKTKTKNKCNLNLWWNPHSQGNKTITDKKTANRMPKEQ